MTIWVTGAALWGVALAALIRLMRVVSRFHPFPRPLLWLVLAVPAGILLFRPHEDLIWGQDAGSYLNTSLTYARMGRLHYEDPLLKLVPGPVRSAFLYGHQGYGGTKDGCVWVQDLGKATVGAHFQAAYPVMMSVASVLFGDRSVLYVVPVFALLAGLALAVLALLLMEHRWAGVLAFLFYVVNPLVVWHGRCARPEILASFFFLAGLALLLHAWRASRWDRWPDLVLAAVCIHVAPFFHITAWFLVIPTDVAAVVLSLRGRDDILIFPWALAAAAGALVCQTLWATDTYHLARFMRPFLSRPVLMTGLGVLGLAAWGGLWVWARRRRHQGEVGGERLLEGAGPSILPWAVAGVVAAAWLILYVARVPVESRGAFLGPVYHYIHPTDMPVVAKLISRPVAVLGLLGVVALLVGSRRRRGETILFAAAMVPATLLIGNMYDFFMTRYALVAIMPVLAIGLAGLATRIPDRGLWTRVALAAAAIGVVALQVHNRVHLIRVIEHKGLTAFLKQFASPIRERNGILLCEYTRVGAPFEHFFGIPALELDNERHDDYTAAMGAWEGIVRQLPDRPAFFLTPFQPPLSDRFEFRPVMTREFADVRLKSERYGLPTTYGTYPLTLTLYSMRLAEGSPSEPPRAPFAYEFDAGNMGLVNFSNLRLENAVIRGAEIGDRAAEVGRLPKAAAGGGLQELSFFCHTAGRGGAAPHFVAPPGAATNGLLWVPLTDNWWLLRLWGSGFGADAPLALQAQQPWVVAGIRALGEGMSEPIPAAPALGPERGGSAATAVKARWTRASSRFLVPLPETPRADILLFFTAPPAGTDGTARVTLTLESGKPVTRAVPAQQWMWEAWRIETGARRGMKGWVEARTEPAWNSGVRGFPPDLGILLGGIVVLPVQPQPEPTKGPR